MINRYSPFFTHTKLQPSFKLKEWVEVIRMQDSFVKNLELVYEFEYKYSKIVSTPMLNERRKDNILHEIEQRMKPIIESVVYDVKRVYEVWIHAHKVFENMNNEELWFKDTYMDVLSDTEAFKDMLKAEYVSYGRKFTKGFKQSIFDYLESLEDKEDLEHFAKDYIYPMWSAMWKKSTINKTIARIKRGKEALDKLDHVKEFKLVQVNLNIAIHTMHQTGSMADHIADFLDCSVKDLERLSNLSSSVLRKWDEDLIEMGIF